MRDDACVRFLQWALPQLHMRWPGFRKVRKRVCKRLTRRLDELALQDADAYQHYLESHPDEWATLDALCRVVVTRFYRDKRVFTELTDRVLPQLAQRLSDTGRTELRAWSIGSASGEEAYSLAIVWHHLLAPRFPRLELHILGTEIDARLIERAQRACYAFGTLKNLPPALREAAFHPEQDEYCLEPRYRQHIEFRQQDIRTDLPDAHFDLIFCRNLVFTYYDEPRQRRDLPRILSRLRPGGWLILGVREKLPPDGNDLRVDSERLGLYQREAGAPQ